MRALDPERVRLQSALLTDLIPSVSNPPRSKRLRLRRPDRCAACETDLPAGTEALWFRAPKLVKCLDCGLDPQMVTQTSGEALTDTPVEDEPVRESERDRPSVDHGVAGGSALREHERRRKKREDRARQKLGVIGVGLVRLAGDPQTTRSWEQGGKAEAHAARRFENHLAGSGVKILHDRGVQGHGSANIDHIAVGPGGVTVIDTKNYKGKVTVERRGGLFSPRREILKIDGRDQTKLIAGAEKQVQYVDSALRAAGLAGVDVRGALCMTEVDGLPSLRSLSVRGIVVDGPKRVAALAKRPGELTPERVDEIWRSLAANFPSA